GRHREAFAQLVALQARPSAAAVRQAQALLEKIAPDKKAEGRAVLETIKEGHRASIRFTPTPEGVVVPPPPRDEARFLFPAPDWQRPPPGSPPTGGAVVPALARGLLFALDPD